MIGLLPHLVKSDSRVQNVVTEVPFLTFFLNHMYQENENLRRLQEALRAQQLLTHVNNSRYDLVVVYAAVLVYNAVKHSAYQIQVIRYSLNNAF